MAKKSINGWEVIESYGSPKLDMKTIPGTTAKIKMRKEVLPLFLALAADYHREVAKIRPRETGAFNPRQSNLSPGRWSDHASGTAVDINWGHEGAVGPNGGMKFMTDAQIKACAKIKQRYEIVIWGGDKARGGDYRQSQFWDPMHYALKPGTTLKDVERVIKKLGIKPNGKRDGVKYGVLATVKAVVAKENTNAKPMGQTLVKPVAKKAVAKKAASAAPKSHTVKSGENLTVIAKTYGVTVPALKKANSLENSLIKVGQKLIIPENTGSAKPSQVK